VVKLKTDDASTAMAGDALDVTRREVKRGDVAAWLTRAAQAVLDGRVRQSAPGTPGRPRIDDSAPLAMIERLAKKMSPNEAIAETAAAYGASAAMVWRWRKRRREK
jgi:hypothetical protein